jgi:hypothetical protein
MTTLKKVSRGREIKTRKKLLGGRKRKTRNKVLRGRKMRGGADGMANNSASSSAATNNMAVGDIVTCKTLKMDRPTLPIAISAISNGSMYSWTGSRRTMYNITDCTKVLNMADDMVPGHLVTCVKDDKTITDPFFITSNNDGTIGRSFRETYPAESCTKLSLSEYAAAVEKASAEFAAAQAARQAQFAASRAAQAARQAAWQAAREAAARASKAQTPAFGARPTNIGVPSASSPLPPESM